MATLLAICNADLLSNVEYDVAEYEVTKCGDVLITLVTSYTDISYYIIGLHAIASARLVNVCWTLMLVTSWVAPSKSFTSNAVSQAVLYV